MLGLWIKTKCRANGIGKAALDEFPESHHSYPCTASIDKNRELGDIMLYRAGYIFNSDSTRKNLINQTVASV
ncbi:hypothetical protein C5S39_10515 [Candidatus Methanophagaceae archaeon]|nr:hypothetical protein C5S39_10515 [Methanophagales archaeon]